MTKSRLTALPAVLLCALPSLLVSAAGEPDPGLAARMGRLQYYVHKLGLAVTAQNQPL